MQIAAHKAGLRPSIEPLEARLLRSATLLDLHALFEVAASDQASLGAQDAPQVHLWAHENALAASLALAPDGDAPATLAKGALETTESGGTASFTVALESQPFADVVIPSRVLDESEATVSTAELVFAPQNWHEAQPVVVTGLDDADDDGDVEHVIAIGPAVSDDPAYAGLDALDVRVINRDNDDPPAPPGPAPNPTPEPAPPPVPDTPTGAAPDPPAALTPSTAPDKTDPPTPAESPLHDVGPADVREELPPWDEPSLSGGASFSATAEAGPAEPGADAPAPPAPQATGALAAADAAARSPGESLAPVSTQAPLAVAAAAPPPLLPLPAIELAGVTPLQQQSLDTAAREIRESAARQSSEHSVLVATAAGSVGIFTGGYLFWAVRGGSLLSSLIMAMPAWRAIDPIPALEFAARRRRCSRGTSAKWRR